MVAELGRLLSMRFVEGTPQARTQAAKSVRRVLEFHNQRQYLLRDVEQMKLRLLVKHLREIERYDPALLRFFRKRLRGCTRRGEYIGARFEANIAASLIRKGVPFKKRESPDFRIDTDDKGVSIECASGHFAGRQQDDFNRKLRSVIATKARKPYLNSRTALFVDLTDVYGITLRKGLLPEDDEIRARLLGVLRTATTGSALLFVYLYNPDQDRLESNYIRVDNEVIEEPLREFLDRAYPRRGHRVERPIVLREG